ncbi:MAG: deoxyguanosinetriphosphate triphosphohydrolase [Candidatus Limimorpha sp.]
MDWMTLLSANRDNKAQNVADIRNEFQRDYDRIVFSNIFRRLQNKTQVFPLPGSKMVHNRLTHSLEVASVGRSIARVVSKQLVDIFGDSFRDMIYDIDTIVSTACLAHDLGNPPFGHSGEETISSYFKDGAGKELQKMMSENQWSDLVAFEGNANAFRQLTHQFKGRRIGGMSLTYASLASLIKYPYPSSDNGGRKKYNVFYSEIDTFVKVMNGCGITRLDDVRPVFARHPLSYMMEAADDICYLILDMEDAHKRGIVNSAEIEHYFTSFFNTDNPDEKWFFNRRDEIFKTITDSNEKISFLRATVINKLVDCVSKVFVANYDLIMEGSFADSLISHLPDYEKNALENCRKFSKTNIYRHPSVVKIEITGFNIIGSLLDDFVQAVLKPDNSYNKRLLSLVPEQFMTDNDDTYSRVQVVLDFISNMTDLYAVQLYKDLRGIE